MLRYDRQTKPGLVALYDVRPGNGAGPFLQPRSPHGATWWWQVFTRCLSPNQPRQSTAYIHHSGDKCNTL